MSLYSYSTILSSSITTVSSPVDEERRILTTDDEQQPIVHDHHWRIEKDVNLKKRKPNSCILKATMMKDRILVADSSSNQSIVLPGKDLSMKVVFRC